MRRALIVLLVPAALVACLAATAAAATEPILGPKAYPYYHTGGLRNTIGFGQVKPRKIYFGGDETGLVCRIDWKGWGNPTARGTGVGWYVGPHEAVAQGHAAVTRIDVSKLRTWKGRPAYNRLKWSFPNRGRDRAAACHL